MDDNSLTVDEFRMIIGQLEIEGYIKHRENLRLKEIIERLEHELKQWQTGIYQRSHLPK